ncbi:hypothetical protein [Bradyrhizobium genosp. A]|uniref:hypothetical protein n=1 Tax=Bradyrhizobium genosp. A TaxID=83626 RepID=UPI003CF35D22
MKMLYRAAQTGVWTAQLVAAAFYFTVAILLLVFALWLVLPFGGRNWLPTMIAAFLALSGLATMTKAAEIFLTTKPPEKKPQPERKRQQEEPNRR